MFTLQIDFATTDGSYPEPYATVYEGEDEYCSIKLETLSVMDLVRLAWLVRQSDRDGIFAFWSKS